MSDYVRLCVRPCSRECDSWESCVCARARLPMEGEVGVCHLMCVCLFPLWMCVSAG